MDGALPRSDERASDLSVRRGQEADVDRLLEIHVAAFPDPRPAEVRRRLFLHNRLGGLGSLRVAERRGTLVGHAFSFPVGVWFGGRVVRGTAVASVGVAPEARGDGVARTLLETIHAEARADGAVFSLLYPFRQRFYARLGYAPLASHRVLTVSPRAIPNEWSTAAPGLVRRAHGADREALTRVYARASARGTGALERTERMWERDLLDERLQWLVLDVNGEIKGYVAFKLAQPEPHAHVTADVHELVAPDDSVRRRLFAALRGLSGQVQNLVVGLAADDPFDWAFTDGDETRPGTEELEHPLGVASAGPMLRLHDVPSALSARGYATDGMMTLAIDGGAPFSLVVAGGEARLGPAVSGEQVLTSSRAIAAVAFGGLRARDAARLGWLEAKSDELLARADHLLALPPFFSVDGF